MKPFELPLEVESGADGELLVSLLAFWVLSIFLRVDWLEILLCTIDLVFLEVILNNFFCSENEWFYNSIFYHLETWNIASNSVDIFKV